MKYIATAIFILTFFSGFSQEEEFMVKEVVHKTGYDYVPLEFMKDSIDGLVGFRLFIDENGAEKSKMQEVSWITNCSEGSYHMVITPEQIYLRTGHDNPNPNRFYWILPIDNSIYLSIEKTLKRNEGNFFGKKYTDGYVLRCNDEYVMKYEGDEHTKKCEFLLKSQILKYFKAFNKNIAVNKLSYSKIIVPLGDLLYNHTYHPYKRIK